MANMHLLIKCKAYTKHRARLGYIRVPRFFANVQFPNDPIQTQLKELEEVLSSASRAGWICVSSTDRI